MTFLHKPPLALQGPSEAGMMVGLTNPLVCVAAPSKFDRDYEGWLWCNGALADERRRVSALIFRIATCSSHLNIAIPPTLLRVQSPLWAVYTVPSASYTIFNPRPTRFRHTLRMLVSGNATVDRAM
jgi:hypothetical protein